MVLNIDLNSPPCEGSSSSFNLQGASTEPSKGLFGSPIDVEETDDEVVLLSSSAAFPQRRNQPRRNRQMTIDLEQAMEIPPVQSGVNVVESAAILLTLKSDSYNDMTSAHTTNISHQVYFNVDEDDCTKMQWQWQRKSARSSSHIEPSKLMMTLPLLQPPPPPPPKEPILSCPLCMDRLTNPCSTFCGHIFCQGCIEASIAAASVKNKAGRQCPTCRAKLPAKKSFHRVYLPIDD